MSDDWLDTGDKFPVAIVVDAEKPADTSPPGFSAQAFEASAQAAEKRSKFLLDWESLTDGQRVFLNTWRECRFNANKAMRVLANTAHSVSKSTINNWLAAGPFERVREIMRSVSVTEILNRDYLAARHDDIVETLLTPKPVLHQGFATGYFETEAGAAGKANEVLLKLGGHLRDRESTDVSVNVGLVTPMLMEVPTTKVDGTFIDVTPVVLPAIPSPDEWLEC